MHSTVNIYKNIFKRMKKSSCLLSRTLPTQFGNHIKLFTYFTRRLFTFLRTFRLDGGTFFFFFFFEDLHSGIELPKNHLYEIILSPSVGLLEALSLFPLCINGLIKRILILLIYKNNKSFVNFFWLNTVGNAFHH